MSTTPHGQVPEALRLADDLEASSHFPGNMHSCNNAAAAELRRLHAYCQELESQVIRDCMTHVQKPADSVLEDAARYRWLREGNDAKHGAARHIAVNLYGCEWDAAIDAARKQGANHD